MKIRLSQVLETSRLSTIKSLEPVLSEYRAKVEEADSVTYDFMWDLVANNAYADFDIALAVGLSRVKDEWLTIGEMLEMPHSFDITRVEHNGKYYYNLNSHDGSQAGLRDALCVDRWWDQDHDIIYDEESGKWMQKIEYYAA